MKHSRRSPPLADQAQEGPWQAQGRVQDPSSRRFWPPLSLSLPLGLYSVLYGRTLKPPPGDSLGEPWSGNDCLFPMPTGIPGE
jgi:hypothetical protein